MLIAFMPWNGYNFDTRFRSPRRSWPKTATPRSTSKSWWSWRGTPSWAFEVNRPGNPNLSETQLNRLDESGIIYVGAEVQPGDVLVGKVYAQRRKPRSRPKKNCCAPSSVTRPRT